MTYQMFHNLAVFCGVRVAAECAKTFEVPIERALQWARVFSSTKGYRYAR